MKIDRFNAIPEEAEAGTVEEFMYKDGVKEIITEFILNNRKLAEESYEEANYDYLEYDRLSQHGTNDVSNIKERFRIIKEYGVIWLEVKGVGVQPN